MVSAEQQPSEEAVERWRKLKSKYDVTAEDAASQTVTSKQYRLPAPSAAIRSIPEDEPQELSNADELANDPQSAGEARIDEPRRSAKPSATRSKKLAQPPLPISEDDDQPAWIYGATAEAEAETEEAPPAPGEDAADPQPIPGQPESNDADEPPTLRPLIPGRAGDEDAGYARPSTSGRPRSIQDILPTYDRTFDEDIRAFAKEQARLYEVPSAPAGPFPQRAFPATAYFWEPSNLYHYPLYFQDPQLERYGHTYGDHIQPFLSIARFGVQTIGLPYQMTIDPFNCPQYVLGWYRPGECAPKLHYQIPLNLKAAAVEAAVVTGLVFAIP